MSKHDDIGRLEPSPDLSWRDVHGELVVVDTRRGDYHVMNALGARVFSEIIDGKDSEAIVAGIAEAHDVTACEARRDVETFVATLVAKGLLATTW